MMPKRRNDPDGSLEELDDIDGPVDDAWREAVLDLERKTPPSAKQSRKLQELPIVVKGGKGSGDFGHVGRPGEVGGSAGKHNYQEFLQGKWGNDIKVAMVRGEHDTIYEINDVDKMTERYHTVIMNLETHKLYGMMGEDIEHGEMVEEIANATEEYMDVDNFMRFRISESGLIDLDIYAAGIVVEEEEDEVKALDSIYDELDRLVARGLPKTTRIRIFRFGGDPIETIAKEKRIVVHKGGKGSGFFGHAGRLGEIGGSIRGRLFGPRRFDKIDDEGMRNYIINNDKKPYNYLHNPEGAGARWYTATGYNPINNYLRKGIKTDEASLLHGGISIEEAVKQMDDFAKSSEIPEDIIVFRGIGNGVFRNPMEMKDTSFVDKGYASTSLSELIAKGEAGYYADDARYHGILAEIRIPRGTRVGMINSREYEIVLPRGTKFKVINVTRRRIPAEPGLPGYYETRMILEVVK